jgi:hypothetical protein
MGEELQGIHMVCIRYSSIMSSGKRAMESGSGGVRKEGRK